ncbi:MAG: putative CsbD stress protein [Modestobacter sp.]|nr:putative CsbD stress protein [Modestobacter sp.]
MIEFVNLRNRQVCACAAPGIPSCDANGRRSDDVSGIDKMKDKAQELAGEGKEAAGKATDDRDLQAEGHKDQAAGNAKQAGEKVKDIFK